MEGEHRRDVETEHSSALWFQIAREGRPPVTVGLIDGARLDALDRLVARLATRALGRPGGVARAGRRQRGMR